MKFITLNRKGNTEMPVIKVVGTVANLIWDSRAIRVWEQYEVKGEQKYRVWTAWGTNQVFDYNEGDTLEIEGDLSTKAGTYMPKDSTEARSVVEHSLNNITVKLLAKASPKASQSSTEPVTSEEDMPF